VADASCLDDNMSLSVESKAVAETFRFARREPRMSRKQDVEAIIQTWAAAAKKTSDQQRDRLLDLLRNKSKEYQADHAHKKGLEGKKRRRAV
jgi:hypothetical protein